MPSSDGQRPSNRLEATREQRLGLWQSKEISIGRMVRSIVSAPGRIRGATVFMLTLLVAFNRPLVSHMGHQWQGISSWYLVVVLALSIFGELMGASSELFKDLCHIPESRKVWGSLHDFFHYGFVPACHAAFQVLSMATDEIPPAEQRLPLQTILRVALLKPAEVARSDVDDALAHKDRAIQRRLAHACQIYERMTLAIEAVLPMIANGELTTENVEQWKAADREFRGWLHGLLADRDYGVLQRSIQKLGGVRVALLDEAVGGGLAISSGAASTTVPLPPRIPVGVARAIDFGRKAQVSRMPFHPRERGLSNIGTSRRDETKIDAVLPLTLRDCERFEITRRSLALFFRDLGTCWVVTPDSQCDAVRSRIQGAQYKVVPESSIIPELKFYNLLRRIISRSHRSTDGWIVQQLIKLAIAERIETQFYLTLDSDVVCTKPVSRAQLIRDGRAICRMRRADVIDQWPEWYGDAERLLRLPRSGCNRGVTPALLHTEAVLQLQALLAKRVNVLIRGIARCLPDRFQYQDLLISWRSYLLRNPPWTEYALYDTFVEATGWFHKCHSEDERTTISGNSVWYRYMWPIWKPERSFSGLDDFYFSVLQSNQGLTVEQVWEKLRPYLSRVSNATVSEQKRTGNAADERFAE